MQTPSRGKAPHLISLLIGDFSAASAFVMVEINVQAYFYTFTSSTHDAG